mmetsp:Transcript_12434/g.29358  ORF Transcript_12434/g.29358 Transcript_12434/m.29358 type:complete len:285 (-) Transcript_12434:21-875(-)
MDWLIGMFVARSATALNSGEDEIVFTSMKILAMLDVIRGADETHSFPAPTLIYHIRQSEKWDCGLACLQMVHCWLCQPTTSKGIDVFKTERQWMRDLVATKSVWTPDLVNALDRMKRMSSSPEEECSPFQKMPNFSFLYCTTRLGVDNSFEDLDYYRDSFQCDELRVKSLLEDAKRRGLPMVQVPRLCLEEFAKVISHSEVVAIVLVDNHVLTKGPCGHSVNSAYRGHYILVSGISKSLDDRDCCMVIVNPGVTVETEFVSPKRFEEAWRAVGTDEDVIFIAKH